MKAKVTFQRGSMNVEVEAEVSTARDLRLLLEALEVLSAPPTARQPARQSNHQRQEKAPVCPVHRVEMRESKKRPGTYYCPERNPDGTYCTHTA